MKAIWAGVAIAGVATLTALRIDKRMAAALDYAGARAFLTGFNEPVADVAHPSDLPAIGKWMLDPDLAPAHWLDARYHGKRLREPINVVIVDRLSVSSAEARERLLTACSRAGYRSREGHSSGYLGYVDGRLYRQLPEGRDHAFANEPFELSNNHGRVFGPCEGAWGYVSIAAFSRERVAPMAQVKHGFVSFNQARDDFVERLDLGSEYKLWRFVDLKNAILDDPEVSTGNHDGMAAVVIAGSIAR